MMKSNPEMFKSIMKSQGMDVSDDQFNMMSNMMTPEMLKMAQEMQKSGVMPQRNLGNQNELQNNMGNINTQSNEGLPNMNDMNSESMKKMRDEIFK